MNRDKQKQMEAEWRSWEYLLREPLELLEHRIQCLHQSISVFGIGRQYRDPFVTDKLIGLIQEVTAEPNSLRPPRLKALG